MKRFIGLGAICLLVLVVAASANTGGPDIYGNTWKDNTEPGGPTFNYIDITSTGNLAGNGDDAAFGPYPFGFQFSFYGSRYDSFYFNTNGLITLTASTADRFNDCPAPDINAPDYWIAPFWDDQNIRSTDGGNVYYQSFDATVDYVVIQWYHFSHYGQYGDPMDMEAILYANGNIVYQYNHINNLQYGHGSSATVGIEKNGTDALVTLCNGSPAEDTLRSGLAIEFYAPVINHDIAVTSIDSPTLNLAVAGASINVTASMHNFGLMGDSFNAYLDVLNSAGSFIFRDTIPMTIAFGATEQAMFPTWTIPIADSLTLVVTAGLTTDQAPDNNSLSTAFKSVNVVSLPVTQDFEGVFPPVGWTIIDRGGENTWTTNTNHYRSPNHSGQCSYGWQGEDTDDWLVLAPINMSNAYDVAWSYYEEANAQWPTDGLRHSFYVSTGDFFDPDAATRIAVHTPADHNLAGFSGDPVVFDLSAYGGNSHVWLAYREENLRADLGTEYWWIDDINIYNVPNNDVGVYSIDQPFGYIRTNCDSPVGIKVKNYGLQAQLFNANVTISGATVGIVYNNTVTGISLMPDSILAVSFPNLTEVAADNYTITATTQLGGDIGPSNNTMTAHFYVSTTIEHTWDDDAANSDLVAAGTTDGMLAVKFTPLQPHFTILGGNIFVQRYEEDPNGYAEFEWVKFCPDAGGVPDIDNAFATIEHVGTFSVPAPIPIDIPDVPVNNYAGDVWIVARYQDNSLYWLAIGTDTDCPPGHSYANSAINPWHLDTDENYMMRLDLQYSPCIGYNPNIELSPTSFTDNIDAGDTKVDTLTISNTGVTLLTYTMGDDAEWLTLSSESGDVPPAAIDTILVTINSTGLAPATYTANISVNSNDPDSPIIVVPVNLTVQSGGCQYVVGDVNNSGTWTGQDVTYGVRFFKGGSAPFVTCNCPEGHIWYVSGDVNGSCTFTGQDVTRMVLHFKSGVPAIVCPDCPPATALSPLSRPAHVPASNAEELAK